jgi:hypothetical protein
MDGYLVMVAFEVTDSCPVSLHASETEAVAAAKALVAGWPDAEDAFWRLRGGPPERRLVVLGENDCKPHGEWPGRKAAVEVSQKLTRQLDRPVVWALPPDKAKDVRQWVLARGPDPTLADEWHDLGDRWRQAIEGAGQTAEAAKGPRFRFLTSAELAAAAEYRQEWLVRRLLVELQAAILGGPKKSL